MTQSENNMVFWGYEYNQGETWKLLLNRRNIIPSCKSFPANTQYKFCDLLVLYFYFTRYMLAFMK